MARIYVIVALASAIFGLTFSASLPSYIKACKLGPEIDQCALEVSNKAIPIMAKGDPKYKYAPLDPLSIPRLEQKASGTRSVSYNFTFIDLKLTGLKDAVVVSVKHDAKKKNFAFVLDVPKLIIKSQYKISGRFLILPIVGEGPCEFILDKVKLFFDLSYDTAISKGQKVYKSIASGLHYEIKGLHLRLENLFNGDKLLGNQMNQVLNDNWEELNNQLSPLVLQGVNLVIRQTVDQVIKDVPAENVIL